MIAAQKWPLFERWFVGHAQRRLAASFHAMNVRGLAETRDLARRHPILVVSNHTAWPDPLVVLALGRLLAVDAYAMMDAKNLSRLAFFKRVGAFGVDRSDPRDGAAAVRYARGLLDRPGRAVWIFPQGETRPVTEPLSLHGGAARVARLVPDARVVPMGVRYEHADDERPSIWVSLGSAIPTVRTSFADVTESHRAGIAHELDVIEERVRARARGAEFEAVFERAPSRLGGLAERALSWLAG